MPRVGAREFFGGKRPAEVRVDMLPPQINTFAARRRLLQAFLLASSVRNSPVLHAAATGARAFSAYEMEMERAEPGMPAARVAAALARDEALLAKGVLPMYPLLSERRDIAALLEDEAAFRARILARPGASSSSKRGQAARTPALATQITRMGTQKVEPPPLSLGALALGYFERLSTAAADPTAVMAAAREYQAAAREANALAELAQRNRDSADSPRVGEYLRGMCEATRRSAASLDRVVALLPAQRQPLSADAVDRLIAAEQERTGRQ